MHDDRLKKIIKEELNSVLLETKILKENDPGAIGLMLGMATMVGIPVVGLGVTLANDWVRRKNIKRKALNKLKASGENVEKIKSIVNKLMKDEWFARAAYQFESPKNHTEKMESLGEMKSRAEHLVSSEDMQYLQKVLGFLEGYDEKTEEDLATSKRNQLESRARHEASDFVRRKARMKAKFGVGLDDSEFKKILTDKGIELSDDVISDLLAQEQQRLDQMYPPENQKTQ